MSRSILFLLLLCCSFLTAQVTVVSTVPANNAKNVPLLTTISLTFSEAIDTVDLESRNDVRFTNVDSVNGHWYSADAKTLYAAAVLKPNTSYFVAFIYAKAKSGAKLASPIVYHFTTGADFPAGSVSGTVASGASGISPAGAIVGLSPINIMKDESDGAPPFTAWANVNNDGSFTIPYVPPGTYWPIAARDVNLDGKIDPESGVDAMAFSDSIVVTTTAVNGVSLTFFTLAPQSFHETIHAADSIAAANLPANRVLRRISGYDADTLGRSRAWEYYYTVNNNTGAMGVRISPPTPKVFVVDQNYGQWLITQRALVNHGTAATSAAVIAQTEAAGGKAFRALPLPSDAQFRIEMSLGDTRNGWYNPGGFDTSKNYWSVAYVQYRQVTQDSSFWLNAKFFLCDFSTGAVVLTGSMGVTDRGEIPGRFALEQNYPNPFNPSTTIRFMLGAPALTTLTVYDMLGREVVVLVRDRLEAGRQYEYTFDASRLTSGVYFYRLTSGSFSETKRMVVVK